MVVFSFTATEKTRRCIHGAAITIHATIIGLLCVTILYEVYSYSVLYKLGIAMKMSQFLPIINHKSAVLAVLTLIVLMMHIIAINIVRGQTIKILRTKKENIGEFIIFMASSLIIDFFGGIFSIVYAIRFETTVASVLLEQMQHYDNNSSNSRAFVDHLQANLACCGVHGMTDYEDFSQVDLIWNTKSISTTLVFLAHFHNRARLSGTTISRYFKFVWMIIIWCSAEAKVCVYPLSCCRSLECTEYGELQLPSVDGRDFHQKWYQKQGCLSAILEKNNGTLQPFISVILIFTIFILEILAIIFSQLTLTAYLSLWESNRSESDDSIAWFLPCALPSVDEIIEDLAVSQSDSSNVNDESREANSGLIMGVIPTVDPTNRMAGGFQ